MEGRQPTNCTHPSLSKKCYRFTPNMALYDAQTPPLPPSEDSHPLDLSKMPAHMPTNTFPKFTQVGTHSKIFKGMERGFFQTTQGGPICLNGIPSPPGTSVKKFSRGIFCNFMHKLAICAEIRKMGHILTTFSKISVWRKCSQVGEHPARKFRIQKISLQKLNLKHFGEEWGRDSQKIPQYGRILRREAILGEGLPTAFYFRKSAAWYPPRLLKSRGLPPSSGVGIGVHQY